MTSPTTKATLCDCLHARIDPVQPWESAYRCAGCGQRWTAGEFVAWMQAVRGQLDAERASLAEATRLCAIASERREAAVAMHDRVAGELLSERAARADFKLALHKAEEQIATLIAEKRAAERARDAIVSLLARPHTACPECGRYIVAGAEHKSDCGLSAALSPAAENKKGPT